MLRGRVLGRGPRRRGSRGGSSTSAFREATYDRATFLLLDGARADVFHDLVRQGALPHVSRHLIERGGTATATTVFPSVTGVAYAPYLTGVFPERTNLAGVKWLDREVYAHRR